MKTTTKWALGFMSGTSADGVDAALVLSDGERIETIGKSSFTPYSPALSKAVRALYDQNNPYNDQVDVIADRVVEVHIKAAKQLLETVDQTEMPVIAGFHGQTIFHDPKAGITRQIGHPQKLADYLNIPVVYDLRNNDIKHGGEGAPLAPIYHQVLMNYLLGNKSDQPASLFANIGGVSNITFINSDKEISAMDTGPGNGLMDDWMRMNGLGDYDENGQLAAQGTVNHSILEKWLQHPYFVHSSDTHHLTPRSLDRQAFHPFLDNIKGELSPQDGASTLCALTAKTLTQQALKLATAPKIWLITGGGVHNRTLMDMIKHEVKASCKDADVVTLYEFKRRHYIDNSFINEQMVEAQAFAILALRSDRGLAISFPNTTGVSMALTGGAVCQSRGGHL